MLFDKQQKFIGRLQLFYICIIASENKPNVFMLLRILKEKKRTKEKTNRWRRKKVVLQVFCFWLELFALFWLGPQIHQKYFEAWNVNDWPMRDLGEYRPKANIREWSASRHCISHWLLFKLVSFSVRFWFALFCCILTGTSPQWPGWPLTGLQILVIKLCFNMMMWWSWILVLILMVTPLILNLYSWFLSKFGYYIVSRVQILMELHHHSFAPPSL